MRNIALTLQYLGTASHGWQVQKTVTTVGQTLEEAAAAVVGHPVHMTGCGRTDAGVHARVYVAKFRTTARIPCDRLPYALNTHLPEDIVVTNAIRVSSGPRDFVFSKYGRTCSFLSLGDVKPIIAHIKSTSESFAQHCLK